MQIRQARSGRPLAPAPTEIIDLEAESTRSVMIKRKRESFPSTQSDGSDDVVELEEAPRHLRKATNRNNPILLEDSDDEQPSNISSDQVSRPAEEKDPAEPLRKRHRPTGSHTNFQGYDPSDCAVGPLAPAMGLEGPLVARSVLPPGHVEFGEKLSRPGPSSAPTLTDDRSHACNKLLPLVLDVLPDIDPKWVLDNLKIRLNTGQPKGDVVGEVLDQAFDMYEGYPKAVDKTAMQAKAIKASEVRYEDPTYRMEERDGSIYWERSTAALHDHFPKMPANQ